MTHEDEVLTLTDEEGNEHEFSVIDMIEMDGSEYAILLPIEAEADADAEADAEADDDADDDADDEEAIILKIVIDDEGNEVLEDIEDDEEWEKVADTYASMIEDEEA